MSSRRKGASSSSSSSLGRKPIPPPLEKGWQWQSRAGGSRPVPAAPVESEESEEEWSDDLQSDEFDSDASEKSHEGLRRSKWFEGLVKTVDELSAEQVRDPQRQWHCPACQRGPGAIEWFQGLQPLLAHARTKGGPRLRHHRALARLLDAELLSKGSAVGPAVGQWWAVEEGAADEHILWPPMVVVMNTQLEKDEDEVWTGMGNPELLALFAEFTPLRAKHSYGPQGHRGMSLLFFEASARGFTEAERLHRQFAAQGADREAWRGPRRALFQGGRRQLYGFLARREDVEAFDQHARGKARVKYEVRSYKEAVVGEIRQMSEDNQQLSWVWEKLAQEKRHSRALEASLHAVSAKLRVKDEETRTVRHRSKLHHQENQEEMFLQEDFFRDQLNLIYQARAAPPDPAPRHYGPLREALHKAHQLKIHAMKKRHWEEELALEEQLSANLATLINP